MAITDRNKSVWKALEAEMWVGAIEEVPTQGFERLSYFKEKLGLRERATLMRLHAMIDTGKAIAKKFFVRRRDGKPDNITHYKLL